jgi:septum formation protein
MILDLLEKINSKSIVLASQSPRRKQLLEQIGLQFKTQATHVAELADKSDPIFCVTENARLKVTAIKSATDLIIASDTIVVQNGKVFEKPADRNDVLSFLAELSNSEHSVFTSVVLQFKQEELILCEETKVTFNDLPKSVIEAYADTDEPYDKAGAYGIQGYGSSFVKKIDGCYFNVMGFPISAFCTKLRLAIKLGYV